MDRVCPWAGRDLERSSPCGDGDDDDATGVEGSCGDERWKMLF